MAKETIQALWSLDREVKEGPTSVVGSICLEDGEPLILNIPFGKLLDWPVIETETGYEPKRTSGGIQKDCIYGFSQKGEYLIFKDVFSPGPEGWFGRWRQKIRGKSLFVSSKPFDLNTCVKSIIIEIPGLTEWFGDRPYTYKSFYKENKLKEIDFHVSSNDFKEIKLFENDYILAAIKEQVVPGKEGPFIYRFEIEVGCILTIEIKGQLTFEEAMEKWGWPIINLLFCLMGFVYCPSSIKFTTQEGSSVEFFSQVKAKKGKPSFCELSSMPFSYVAIKGNIEKIFSSYFSFDQDARNSFEVLTGLMRNWEMPSDLFFLASMQAFEAIARSGVDQFECTENELKEKLKAIKDSDVPKTIKEWANQKLRYANIKSTRSLIGDLLNKLEPFASYIVSDLKRFKNDCLENRNAFTHRRNVGAKNELANRNLYVLTEAVQLLVYGAITQKIGFSGEEVLQRFKESGYKSQWISKAQKLYATEGSNNKGEAD